MYVCKYVCMYVRTYVRMYYVSICVCLYVCTYVCMYHACGVSMHMCIYVRNNASVYIYIYTGCPRRNVPDFRRVFLMLKYTDITQNIYVQS